MFYKLNYDLIREIMRFVAPKKWIIRPDIPNNIITYTFISKHPQAFDYLMEHNEYIDWGHFSSQPYSEHVDYLLQHPEYINWVSFSSNRHPKAKQYCMLYPDLVCWNMFSIHTDNDSVQFMINHNHLEKISLYIFSINPNPLAVSYMMDKWYKDKKYHFEKNTNQTVVEFYIKLHKDKPFSDISSEFFLNENDTAISFLLQHVDQWTPHQWSLFCTNKNKRAITFVMQHPDRINWDKFSTVRDRDAFSFMIRHPQRVVWSYINLNPADYAVDYLLLHTEYIHFTSFIMNQNRNAFEYCLQQIDKFDVWLKSMVQLNPSIFIPKENKEMIELLTRSFLV